MPTQIKNKKIKKVHLQYQRCSKHLWGTLPVEKNASQYFAKKNYNRAPKKITESNRCEFHLVASSEMRIWQQASVGHYLHCLKVDGYGEENQCRCKQPNGRVMCSPGREAPEKSRRGNVEQGAGFGRRSLLPARPSLSSCQIQSTAPEHNAVFSCRLLRMPTLQGRQSKRGLAWRTWRRGELD